MKIVFVLSGLGAGGAEKIVNLVAHHRLARGDTVHVIPVNATGPESYFPYDGAISVEPLVAEPLVDEKRQPLPASGMGWRLLALRRRLQALQPDLVISFLTKINILVGLATWGLNTAVIMSERNNFRSQEMHVFWRLARPFAARLATSLVMQTNEACRCLPEKLKAKAVIIPNPVALPAACARAPGDGTRLIAVGRLDKQKGFDLLLQAFRSVAAATPTATLTIFGEGPQRPALEQQVRDLGLGDRVRMPGVTKSPADWTSAGDIFVLSSRFEGFPNVLLEAMTAGLAVIAFNCPWGPSEILSSPDTGLLVPAADVERLADAIRRLITDRTLREKLASAAAVAATTRYATSSVLQLWDDTIAASVARRPSLSARRSIEDTHAPAQS
ncbi:MULTISPECIES: glycosyltransferase [unclassified Sinorhizobium]|uniref:glycosyltransferase n=1 Tax=unclassified Sinorhizobium TaxID=2613772 RepID=UPI0024C354DF|nr:MULTISPECIES: glycosyltransferase [unclassified Sinorhizobium]MDK1374225.1 glycosyltransferase [Sinorhizobium sp. 6-70]MDK1480447.1 glycosyltransferase [Sinorhizobium sp. 6-117]